MKPRSPDGSDCEATPVKESVSLNGFGNHGRSNGHGPQFLLIEDLDALGAGLDDVRRRAARIHAHGAHVTWIAVASETDASASTSASAMEGQLVTPAEAREVIAELLAGESWDHVVLASAAEGGGPLARWLPRDARWWPSGFSSSGRGQSWARMAARALGERRLDPLDGASAWGSAWLLGWSEIDAPASRRPGLPLWDGDLVLALSGLSGASGGPTIEAFATLTESWSGVDLVAWSHPESSLERRARASGIEMRVHHVGPAPRQAESSWLAQASAAMLSAGPRVSTALVLRTLAAGCPLIWVAPGGRSSGVARWLAEQECARVVPAEPSAITQALSDMLDRDSEVERMIERGKALAASHGPRRLSDRLAAVIATSPPKRRAA